MDFFNIFMDKNVGITKGCKWARLRKLNEKVLFTDKLHLYSKKINNDIENYLVKNQNKLYNY